MCIYENTSINLLHGYENYVNIFRGKTVVFLGRTFHSVFHYYVQRRKTHCGVGRDDAEAIWSLSAICIVKKSFIW